MRTTPRGYAIEPRAAVGSYNRGTGQLTLWATSQNPHIHRFICSVMLKLPEHRIRIIAPEVGGGFGSKIPVYADEALVGLAAMDLGRPVKWTEDRSENYKATICFTAPTAYRAMLAAMEHGADLSSLRVAVSAGETLPAPVFEGDTVYARSEVLEARPSRSRPKVGLVRVKTTGANQHGVPVIEFTRTFMVWKRGHVPSVDRRPRQ